MVDGSTLVGSAQPRKPQQLITQPPAKLSVAFTVQIQVEEGDLFAGNRAQQNRLKSFITDDSIVLEEKGKEPFQIDFFGNIVITTNEK